MNAHFRSVGNDSIAMMNPTILAATWRDGLFVISGEACHHEVAGQSVRALASDGHGGALAIVDEHSICRRTPLGKWNTIATSKFPLSCSVAVGELIYVGTDDAHVLRVSAKGDVDILSGFDAVPGRDAWYAGSALINGKLVGPPLGIRSIAATADGAVLLANVHVGGVPRSTDSGASWQPTIDIESDVHEVCAHPVYPEIVVGAAAIGLCISRDGGAKWTIEHEGLHALYCSAVAFVGNDILVAASADHFATQGAVYRRSIDGEGTLVPVDGGFPRWTDGIVDTDCIDARASAVCVADKGGNLYVSNDAGRTWLHRTDRLPAVSSILLV
jgi:hypothetical protein